MRARGGFTLLETAVAAVIGGLVVSSALALFLALSRAESVLSVRSEQITDMSITQQVMRRSFMTLVLLPTGAEVGEDDPALRPDEDSPNQAPEVGTPAGAAGDEGPDPENPAEDDGDPGENDAGENDAGEEESPEALAEAETVPRRPRVILEVDRSPSLDAMVQMARRDGLELLDPTELGLGYPQRLEVVTSQTPVPRSLGANRGWARRTTALEEELFAAQGEEPPEEAGVRGVYELRPDGIRELLVVGYTLGELGAMTPAERDAARRRAGVVKPLEGWTLWWRPVTAEEYVLRQRGVLIDPATQPRFLEGATPLASGLQLAYWEFVKAEPREVGPDGEPLSRSGPVPKQWLAEYRFWRVDEIVGYAEFTVETAGGMFSDWMFEVGWSIDDEGFDQSGVRGGAGASESDADGSDEAQGSGDDDGGDDGRGEFLTPGRGGETGGARGGGTGRGTGRGTGGNSGAGAEARG